MKKIMLGLAFAAASTFAAYAQTEQSAGEMKLSQAECESLWSQLSPDGAPISEAKAGTHVTDFKAANPDGDSTLDKTEFSKACADGLVKSSASSGAGAGESGAADPGAAPGAAAPDAGESGSAPAPLPPQ
jgi:hypothetical protein